ncbi:MAG: hypothetical protein ACOX81_02415 [Candidatus Heteroscillospira sp.]|jgi:hypothetical protein
MNFAMLEKYASPITVYSDISPQGRPERGFVQPLELRSELAALPDRPGRGGGKYLLIAGPEAIEAQEKSVRVGFGGALFRMMRREEYGLSGTDHIECLLRYLGRETDA